MKCKCPNCKKEFDITEVVEPIRRKAIEDFTEEILKLNSKKDEKSSLNS